MMHHFRVESKTLTTKGTIPLKNAPTKNVTCACDPPVPAVRRPAVGAGPAQAVQAKERNAHFHCSGYVEKKRSSLVVVEKRERSLLPVCQLLSWL
jgi:hypothetical protein